MFPKKWGPVLRKEQTPKNLHIIKLKTIMPVMVSRKARNPGLFHTSFAVVLPGSSYVSFRK